LLSLFDFACKGSKNLPDLGMFSHLFVGRNKESGKVGIGMVSNKEGANRILKDN
jgi:hypothetical protein